MSDQQVKCGECGKRAQSGVLGMVGREWLPLCDGCLARKIAEGGVVR